MSSDDQDMQALQTLRSQFSSALKDFASSLSSFRILHTVPPASAPSHGKSISTRTLYVLDSSFNPPSKAHASLIRTALKSQRSLSETRDATPRVLFLLATVNADKKPKPADFEDRIVMMSLAAKDLRDSLGELEPIIDVGITRLPYFVDKASSIDSSKIYRHPIREDGIAEQVHLTGFDTLLRIFTPKYYPDHDPPLSALEPFLENHKVRATIRVDPDSPSANLKDAQSTRSSNQSAQFAEADFSTIDGQKQYLQGIKNGSLEKEGMQTRWADQVELVVDESGEAEGVSSTKVRNAVIEKNWEEVRELVGRSVGEYIETQGLYGNEDGGGKL